MQRQQHHHRPGRLPPPALQIAAPRTRGPSCSRAAECEGYLASVEPHECARSKRCMNRFACALALVLTVAACSSSHHVPVATSSTTSRSTPASLPPVPSDTSLSFSGDSGLDGGLSKAEITCSFPDVEGLRISIFAQAPDSRFSYRIAVGAERVLVHVDSGSGPTFRERNFEGTGVSGFDAARGAHVDAKL